MIMVIFGAGASYDSVPARPPGFHGETDLDGIRSSFPMRPPLATELFLDTVTPVTESIDLFPRCKPIIPRLRSIPAGVTLEHVLDTLQAQGDRDPERKRQFAAIRFYLQRLIERCEDQWDSAVAHGITNYATLLDQLRRSRREDEPLLLVTFNYDRMIERAVILSLRISTPDLPYYIQDNAFKLFKLHGSVHWGREVEAFDSQTFDSQAGGLALAQEMIEGAPGLKITDRFRLKEGLPMFPRLGDSVLFPAIAIPVETKLDFECPADHLECLRKHLGKVTKVLTVGWAAQEQQFLKLLRGHLKGEIRVQAVAGSSADGSQVLDRIKGAGISIVAERPIAGFTEYANSSDAERFFAPWRKE